MPGGVKRRSASIPDSWVSSFSGSPSGAYPPRTDRRLFQLVGALRRSDHGARWAAAEPGVRCAHRAHTIRGNRRTRSRTNSRAARRVERRVGVRGAAQCAWLFAVGRTECSAAPAWRARTGAREGPGRSSGPLRLATHRTCRAGAHRMFTSVGVAATTSLGSGVAATGVVRSRWRRVRVAARRRVRGALLRPAERRVRRHRPVTRRGRSLVPACAARKALTPASA
jgi:hypothetical protein